MAARETADVAAMPRLAVSLTDCDGGQQAMGGYTTPGQLQLQQEQQQQKQQQQMQMQMQHHRPY